MYMYDSEDGYDTMSKLISSDAFSRAYSKETDEEFRTRKKAEYEEMLLKPIKSYIKVKITAYDQMLMRIR